MNGQFYLAGRMRVTIVFAVEQLVLTKADNQRREHVLHPLALHQRVDIYRAPQVFPGRSKEGLKRLRITQRYIAFPREAAQQRQQIKGGLYRH
jgi:hypothetical protein